MSDIEVTIYVGFKQWRQEQISNLLKGPPNWAVHKLGERIQELNSKDKRLIFKEPILEFLQGYGGLNTLWVVDPAVKDEQILQMIKIKEKLYRPDYYEE